MQSILRSVLACTTTFCMTAATSRPSVLPNPMRSVGPHLVTIHIESLTRQPTTVHIKADSAALWQRGDSAYRAEITVDTPNDVIVGLQVRHLELRTDDRQPVKVQFTDGATDAEKALHPWGWLMSFRRVNGDFQPEAKVVPVVPVSSPGVARFASHKIQLVPGICGRKCREAGANPTQSTQTASRHASGSVPGPSPEFQRLIGPVEKNPSERRSHSRHSRSRARAYSQRSRDTRSVPESRVEWEQSVAPNSRISREGELGKVTEAAECSVLGDSSTLDEFSVC